jgi:hypothetical protein
MFHAWKYHAFPLSLLALKFCRKRTAGFSDAGEEMMHTYSSILQPP